MLIFLFHFVDCLSFSPFISYLIFPIHLFLSIRFLFLGFTSKEKIIRGLSCSHYRAAEYFTESIADRSKFHSYFCKDSKEFADGKCHLRTCQRGFCNNMGYHAKKVPGKYFLNTNNKAPYAGKFILLSHSNF